MRKNIITLVVGLVAIILTYIYIYLIDPQTFLLKLDQFPPSYNQGFNYQELSLNNYSYLFINKILISIVIYAISTYLISFLINKIIKKKLKFEPVFAPIGGIVGILIASLFIYLYFSLTSQHLFDINPFVILFLVLMSLFGIRISLEFKTLKSNYININFISSSLISIIIILIFIFYHHQYFPGVNASAKSREKWAYQEFSDYDKIVNVIKSCEAIIIRVGHVKLIAPTQGKNYVIYDPGSSGHRGEMTLEVIGEKATGIYNFSFSIETTASRGWLTYQNKREKIYCKNDLQF